MTVYVFTTEDGDSGVDFKKRKIPWKAGRASMHLKCKIPIHSLLKFLFLKILPESQF